MAKLNYLMTLPAGWDGPGSQAVTDQAAHAFAQLLKVLPASLTADAEPMATPDGGLRMEWDRGMYSYVAELLGNGGMYLCALGPDDDADLESDDANIATLLRFFEDGTIAR
ncbi:hypothetical protein IU421_14810 [Nocardia cyriacigeorgica]|uniref:hypothetical protein n=1 Tax=Nocardia cyriacigeorgica TaxID=135487 RepID=UPI001895FF97|nr:hypothetical protein [Nocardia cyriacigeorgica]MBF6515541.1 hypothetical protein [Nocardia cyriacigeorgica]